MTSKLFETRSLTLADQTGILELPMKVFVSEYVCGGGWPGAAAPASLLREGRAMLRAIVEDLARVPECRVVTTLAAAESPLDVDGTDVVCVQSPADEAKIFSTLAAESDACLIIAPELENELARRCSAARRAGARRVLNPAGEIVALCSDKLRLCEFLMSRGIPTIPTVSWSAETKLDHGWLPIVIKPQFGAGSQDICVYGSFDSARQSRPVDEMKTISPDTGWVVQPLVAGTAVSVGVLCDPAGERHTILPVAAQHLTDDGRFEYLGGRIPWNGPRAEQVRTLAARTCQMLSPLDGYIGFDIVVPVDDSAHPLIVEINPRLTTSYLGYRKLAAENLAARMLTPSSDSSWQWLAGDVDFASDGTFSRRLAPILSEREQSI